MDNKISEKIETTTRKPYKKPEIVKLGQLNTLIRGSYSCGRPDLGQEGQRSICGG